MLKAFNLTSSFPLEHLYALQKSIAYCQAMCIKRIYSAVTEYKNHSKAHEKALANKNYQRGNVRKEIEKVAEKERENILNKPIKEEPKQILYVGIT